MATFDLTTGQGTGQIGTATGLSKMVMVEKVFDVKKFQDNFNRFDAKPEIFAAGPGFDG